MVGAACVAALLIAVVPALAQPTGSLVGRVRLGAIATVDGAKSDERLPGDPGVVLEEKRRCLRWQGS
jgi:hypothetical protein